MDFKIFISIITLLLIICEINANNSLTHLKNGYLILNCDINENQVKLIQWQKDNIILDQQNDKYEILPNGSLKLNIQTKSYGVGGLYKCLILNNFGKFIKTIIKLDNYLSSDFGGFDKEPQNRTIQNGQSTLLLCKLNLTTNTLAPNDFNYEWFKNSNLININSNNNKYILHNDGSLEITQLTNDDIGYYKCAVKHNSEYIESKSAFLNITNINETVSSLPSFQTYPIDSVANEKNQFLFECSTFAQYHNYVTFKWLKDGSLIKFDDENNVELTQQTNLLIKNLSEHDTGSYTCRICTLNNECDERTAYLTVQIAPRFLKVPKNVNTTIKTDVDFECNVYGIPEPTIKWYKNGELISPSEYFQYINETNLRILGIIKQDEGYYQCIATNIVSTKMATASLVIQNEQLDKSMDNYDMNDDDLDHIQEPQDFKVDKYDSRSLSLSWKSAQNIKYKVFYMIKWKANEDNRERVLNTSQTNIILDDLKPSTSYQIKICSIFNSTLKSRSSILNNIKTLDEERMPDTPYDLNAEFLTYQTVKIKWKMPIDTTNTHKVFKYRLYIKQIPLVNQYYLNKTEFYPEKHLDIQMDHLSVLRKNEFNFILEDLKKFCKYTFRLVSINTRISRSSEKIEIQTVSDVPDGIPENIKVNVINTTSVKIQWDLPPLDKCNGIISGYKLELKENMRSQITYLNVNSEPNFKIINNLQAGRKYLIRILARTINGTGSPSEWFIAQTYLNEMSENKVPEQPMDLLAEPSDTAIIVRWLPPKDSNTTIIRRYLLKYGMFMPDIEIDLDSSRSSYVIENLQPSSQYILSLKAGNSLGYGEEIFKEVLTKRQSALNQHEYLFPPLNLQASAISQTIIDLSWTDWHLKQEEQIPDDRFYTVRYCISETTKYKYKNSTERTARIDDLKPNILYDFAVKLVYETRESDWSLTTSQMTMEPSKTYAPREIRFKSEISKMHVNTIISWDVQIGVNQEDLNSNIVYVISYADEQSFKENKWKQEYINKETAINLYKLNANEPKSNTANTHKMQTQIRKLKPNTVYYIKIQERNNREYVSQSDIVLYKTPNLNGDGAILIKSLEQKFQRPSTMTTKYLTKNELNSKFDGFILWIIIAAVSFIVFLIITIFIVISCRKTKTKNKGLVKTVIDNKLSNGNQQKLLINTQTSGSTLLLNSNQTWLCTNQTNSSSSAYGGTNSTNCGGSSNGVMSGTNDNLCTTGSVISGHASTTSTIKQQLQLQQRLQLLNDDDFNELQPLNMTPPPPLPTEHLNDYLMRSSNFNNNNDNNNEMNSFEAAYLRQSQLRNKFNGISASPLQDHSFSSTMQRKSFKNLQMTSSALLPTNMNLYSQQINEPSNFNQYLMQQHQHQPQNTQQKLNFQILSDIDQSQFPSHLSDYCTHSPCSSVNSNQTHTMSHLPYDKIGNVLNEMSANKTFGSTSSSSTTRTPQLIQQQQLKSFSSNVNTHHHQQQQQQSIPNTPRHIFMDHVDNQNLVLKSPNISLFNQYNHQKSQNESYFNPTVRTSIDNIYDKKLNNEELTAEMANLEGIMKDLTAITNQQHHKQF